MSFHHVVINPDGPDLEFDGELILDETHFGAGRIKVFHTVGGQYIVEQVRHAPAYQHPLCRIEAVERKDDLQTVLEGTEGGRRVLATLGQPNRKIVKRSTGIGMLKEASLSTVARLFHSR